MSTKFGLEWKEKMTWDRVEAFLLIMSIESDIQERNSKPTNAKTDGLNRRNPQS